jgi:hypothetical protein
LALTFGTLLSSQGADALVLQPFRPSFETISPLYTALRNGRTSGARPAVDQAGGPVRSRSVQGERYTTLSAPRTGVRSGAALLSAGPVTRTDDALGRLAGHWPGDVWRKVVPPHPRSSSWSRRRVAGHWAAASRRGPRRGPWSRPPAAPADSVTAAHRGQATPRGRNCTLTRGPTGFVVFGTQCSRVRWHEPPMTTRSPCPKG